MLSRLPVKLKQNSGFVCEPSFTKVKRPDRVMIKTVVPVRQTAFLFHNIIVYVLISPDQKRRVPSRSIFKNSKLYVSMQHQSNRILICWYITIFAYLAFYAQLQLSGYLKKKKNLKETQRLSLVSESTSKQAILTDGQFYLNAIEAKGFSTVSASYKQISINKQHQV